MQRFLLGFFLAISLASALIPLAVHAAVLPSCDQTIYLIPPDDNPGGCNVQTGDGCIQKTPTEYERDYPTQEDKERHPPIVTTLRKCGFNDFVQLFINLSTWGLGILAVLGLLFMIVGGFQMVNAAGNQEKIRTAKMTIWGAVLGIIIVLTSYVFIGFIVASFTGTGYTLFAGTPFARQFAGISPCLQRYAACSYNNLKLRCRDDERMNRFGVTKAQTILEGLGCYRTEVDGCFGPQSCDAVKAFQAANAGCWAIVLRNNTTTDLIMPPPGTSGYADGIIGEITWAFLDAAASNHTIVCPREGGSGYPLGDDVPVRRCTTVSPDDQCHSGVDRQRR